MKAFFERGWKITAFCPTCHRPLFDVGIEYKAGTTAVNYAGRCSQHGKVSPAKVYFKPILKPADPPPGKMP